MKYETIGGEIKDTRPVLCRLAELKSEDIFTNKNHHGKWKVIGKCVFNASAGSATRTCLHIDTNMPEQKLCRMDIVRLLESEK
jgi:hypothetical protein